VAPLSVEEFIRSYWTKAPFFSKGPPGRLNGFALAEDNVASVLDQAMSIDVWGSTLRIAEKANVALHLYEREGATLYIHLVRLQPREESRGFRAIPPNPYGVRGWLESLVKRFGAFLGLASVFAVTRNRGSGAHFDRNENFTIQLRGTKVWR